MKFHSSFTFALSPCNVLRSLTSSVKGCLVKDHLVALKKRARRKELIVSLCNRTAQEEEDGKTLVRDEPDKAITSVFCRDLQ